MGTQNWFLRFLGFGPYFRQRSGALEGIFVASSVGVVSGIYIFKPLFEEMAENKKIREAREAQEAASAATSTNGSATASSSSSSSSSQSSQN